MSKSKRRKKTEANERTTIRRNGETNTTDHTESYQEKPKITRQSKAKNHNQRRSREALTKSLVPVTLSNRAPAVRL